tara:strand:+ start:840 stop:2420 length:1581 start_codon:yes stop_codon:yes gene_type:complete
MTNFNKKTLLICFTIFATFSFSQNIKKTVDTPKWLIKQKTQKIQTHVKVLASDSLEGREVGTVGELLAADYISNYFQQIGISPYKDSTYYQEFDLGSREFDFAKIKIGHKRYFFGHDFFSFPKFGSINIESKDLVFLGYGIDSENYNDYNVDVQNKIIIVFDGEPTNTEGDFLVSGTQKPSPKSHYKEKLKTAKQRGAKAILIIKENLKRSYKSSIRHINNPGVFLAEKNDPIPFFFIDKKMAKNLIGAKSLDSLKRNISHTKKTITKYNNKQILIESQTKERFFTGKNIIGFVEGDDPQLKNEIIVITAHYDHIGIIDGLIHNGADDNATGTAALLEVAESFQDAKKAGKKFKRSVLFLPNSAEEKGLLGSYYYVENPVFPLENTITCLNVDMIGRPDKSHPNDSNYVYLIGSDKLSTDLHSISEATNNQHVNLNIDYTYNDPNDPNRFYYRSDHYNFAKKNIPSIFYFSGVHEDYHMNTDTYEKIIYEKVEKTARLIFHTAWNLANEPVRPRVDRQNNFKQTRN